LADGSYGGTDGRYGENRWKVWGEQIGAMGGTNESYGEKENKYDKILVL